MKRAVLIGAGVLAMLFLGPGASAAPLTADVLGCTSAPTPEVPGRGITGFFESPPETIPPPGDPFLPDATTTIYEQFGYAGLRFTTYDLGCGPDIARNPDAAIGTSLANWIMLLPKTAVAATGATLSTAFSPDFLGVFDPLIDRVVRGLRDGIWTPWFPLVLAATGFFFVAMARRQQVSETATAIGGALLIMVLVSIVFRWPLVAPHAADESLTAVLGKVSAGLNGKDVADARPAGQEATAVMHEALLYQAWLGGTFGSADSAVAKKYGPTIFRSTALSWAEAKILADDPEAGKEIIEAKKSAFEDAASKIKDADPDAYDYLTGKRSDTRVGWALLAALATLCAVPFLFLAALLVLGALLIVRFGVMVFPGVATLGLFPKLRHLVTGVAGTIVAGLINACVFGVGALVFLLCLGVSLAAPVAPWQRILLVLLMTLVFWFGLKPYRHLTQMPSGGGAFTDAVTGPRRAFDAAKRLAGKAAGTAILGGVGGAAAGKVIGELQPEEPPQRAEARPDPFPTVIHPPAEPMPAVAAHQRPTVIVADVTDLPGPPARALPSGAHRGEAGPAPVEPDPGPPTRMEGAEQVVDWPAYESELTKENR